MFQLTIRPRGGEARSYLLNRERITMGSDPECDVVISSPFVAPLVARLEWEEGRGFRLQAAPGQRSLTVNGQPVLSALLEDGDQIRNGEFTGTLHAVADEARGAWGPSETGAETLPKVEELEGALLRQTSELNELRPLRALLEETRKQLERTSAELEAARAESEAAHRELAAQRQRTQELSAQITREREGSTRAIQELHERLEQAEKRLDEAGEEARSRIERAHDAIGNLRKLTVQQDGELREQRQALLKLQQAKNAAETQLEALRKSYLRERKQHGRLVEQFRERALRETARADRALDELARTRQSNGEPG